MNWLRIKWENITLIIFSTFFIYCIVVHISKNGFNLDILMFEILLYGLVLFMNYIAIGSFRKLVLQDIKERK